MVIWLLGLSGAGKTTVAKVLYDRLKPRIPALVHLDGDTLREVWGGALGHTMDDRRTNAERSSRLCKLLDAQGISVIVSILSVFPEWQKWNRDELSRYFQVYLDVPISVLESRDTKGIYRGARLGEIDNVVGVDLPFPEPYATDLTLSGDDALLPPEQQAELILRHLGELS